MKTKLKTVSYIIYFTVPLVTFQNCGTEFEATDEFYSLNLSSKPPLTEILILQPEADTLTMGPVRIGGICSNGIEVEVSGNIVSSPLTIPCLNGTFEADISMAGTDGVKAISVVQEDSSGNKKSDSRAFRKDNTAPQLLFLSPAANAEVTSPMLLTGQCESGLIVSIAGSGLTGPQVASCTNSTFQANLNLIVGEGPRAVSISQADLAGNSATTNRTFQAKNPVVPPLETRITSPAANSATTGTIVLQGTCVTGLNVRVFGSGVPSAGLNTACNNSAFSLQVQLNSGDGPKIVQVEQINNIGAKGTDTRSFVLDTQMPAPRILLPVANASFTTNLVLSGSCENGIPVIIQGSGVSSSFATSCSNLAFSAPVVLSSGDGAKIVEIKQTDSAGNVGTNQRSFVKDNTAPLLTIASPAVNTDAETGLRVQGACESNLDVVVQGSGVRSAVTQRCSNSLYAIDILFTEGDGNKLATVMQTDVAGNATTVQRQFVRKTLMVEPPGDPLMNLSLARVKSGGGKEIEASVSRQDRGWNVADQLQVTANQGATVTRLTNIDSVAKVIRYRITPATGFNGELNLRASFLNSRTNATEAKEKMALVLEEVHSSFGQPEVVRGLVNTRGHEDGLSISPDGEWLMIHYLPISFDCYLKGGGSATSPDCTQVVGPVRGPERPDMPGISRITANNQIVQSCPRNGLINPSFSVAPSTYYIFRKNIEGEFVSPREFSFLNGEGCFFPFGPQLQMSANGSARLYISWQNYFSGHNDGNDVQGMNVDLSTNFLMGIMPQTGQISSPVQLSLQRLNIPAAGEQGNPHVHEDSTGSPSIVLWDDETQSESNRRIKFVSKQGGTWSNAKELPPSIFNTVAGGAIQPFYDGSKMIFRAGGQINMSIHNGGAMESASSWGAPQALVRANQSNQVGRVMTLGEPSITFDRYGKQVLYFVYATIRADQKADFNVAFVPMD